MAHPEGFDPFAYGASKIYAAEFHVWGDMKHRCQNPANKRWADYGGRGITVCQTWLDSFNQFLADMGPRPSDKHSLDRIDNNAGYSPKNCRWATAKQQQRNNRRNKLLTHNGETLTVIEWSERTGIDSTTIHVRLKRGWSVADALSSKAWGSSRKGSKTFTYKGITKNVREWAIQFGFKDVGIVYDRMQRGWTVEEALLVPVGMKRTDRRDSLPEQECYDTSKAVRVGDESFLPHKRGVTKQYPKEYAIWFMLKREAPLEGTSVCDRWLERFANFLADVGPRPSKQHRLQRKDKSKNYCKENCHWMISKKKENHLPNSTTLTFNGITKTITEWSKETNIPVTTLHGRIRYGWSIEDALQMPVRRKRLSAK